MKADAPQTVRGVEPAAGRLVMPGNPQTIWTGGLLGWVSLALLALMVAVVIQIAAMRNDFAEMVITQGGDTAAIHTEVKRLRAEVKELKEALATTAKK